MFVRKISSDYVDGIQMAQNMDPLLAIQNKIIKPRFPQMVNFLACWMIIAFTRSRFCDLFVKIKIKAY